MVFFFIFDQGKSEFSETAIGDLRAVAGRTVEECKRGEDGAAGKPTGQGAAAQLPDRGTQSKG